MIIACEYKSGVCVRCGREGSTVRACHMPPDRSVYSDGPKGSAAGPGTILSGIFRKLGYAPDSRCSCKSVSREMDGMGRLWCIKNSWSLGRHVSMNAASRGLWCPTVAGAILVFVAALCSTMLSVSANWSKSGQKT